MFFEKQVNVPTVVFPGTDVSEPVQDLVESFPKHSASEPFKIKLGPGLKQNHDQGIRAYRLGRFNHIKGRRFWLQSRFNYYLPSVNDFVVGIVTVRTAEFYKVDINYGVYQAILKTLAFDGATRKNRPNLNVGSLVYARVTTSSTFCEPELECTSADGVRNDEGFGPIKDGVLARCSSSFSQQLQLVGHTLLKKLGSHFAFESIIGANGLFVIRSSDPELSKDLADSIKAAERVSEERYEDEVVLPLVKKYNK